MILLGFTGGSDSEEFSCYAGDLDSIPGLGRPPWKREQLLSPVFLPGEFHGQRSLIGYSSWSSKESDTNEQLTHFVTHTCFPHESHNVDCA